MRISFLKVWPGFTAISISLAMTVPWGHALGQTASVSQGEVEITVKEVQRLHQILQGTSISEETARSIFENSDGSTENIYSIIAKIGLGPVRLETFAAIVSSMDGNPYYGIDYKQYNVRSQISEILSSIDGMRDFRELFTSQIEFVGSGIVNRAVKTNLFSTFDFRDSFLKAGTNRLPIVAIFNNFLCSPLTVWKDGSLDPLFIGRDIISKPGGKTQNYDEECRTCHAAIDPMRGAFAYLENLIKEVNPKYAINATNNPRGFTTRNDYWEIPLVTPEHQAYFGWRTPTKGYGLHNFAQAIVNSERFDKCMTARLISTFCNYDQNEIGQFENESEFDRLHKHLRSSGYQIRSLIREIALSPYCSPNSNSKSKRLPYKFGGQYVYDLNAGLTGQIVGADGIAHRIIMQHQASLPRGGDAESVRSGMPALAKAASTLCSGYLLRFVTISKPISKLSFEELFERIYRRKPSEPDKAKMVRDSKGKMNAFATCMVLSLHDDFLRVL